jgi:hypothetical protein
MVHSVAECRNLQPADYEHWFCSFPSQNENLSILISFCNCYGCNVFCFKVGKCVASLNQFNAFFEQNGDPSINLITFHCRKQ